MPAKKALAADIQALNDVLLALEHLEDAEKSWVLQTAASRLGISLLAPAKPGGSGAAAGGARAGRGASGGEPKDFMRQKDPENDVQRAACLAYYLTHHRATPHFKSRDLSNLNTEAAGPRLNMSRALNNATNQNHYVTSAGGGKKQITTRGEEVVEALPDRDAAKVADSKARPTRKKGRGRKKVTAKAKRG